MGKSGFFAVPCSVFKQGLGPMEGTVYIYLCHELVDGVAEASYGEIARACNISRITAIRAIRALKGKSLINIETRKTSDDGNDRNAYRLVMR
ncbi:MAG: hypothetical protein GYA36_21830 [Veillonellaceae bacterium]|nr:hypothetical protein [Veillonellaceae bacterium]